MKHIFKKINYKFFSVIIYNATKKSDLPLFKLKLNQSWLREIKESFTGMTLHPNCTAGTSPLDEFVNSEGCLMGKDAGKSSNQKKKSARSGNENEEKKMCVD